MNPATRWGGSGQRVGYVLCSGEVCRGSKKPNHRSTLDAALISPVPYETRVGKCVGREGWPDLSKPGQGAGGMTLKRPRSREVCSISLSFIGDSFLPVKVGG